MVTATRPARPSVEKVLPLSKAAQALLEELPVLGPFVFSGNGRSPMGGLGKRKAKLDKLSGTTGWVIHYLRRTARSLMSRAGVDGDIAERCLGHVVGGILGFYDRYEYLKEKRIGL
jgi:integrase